MVRKAKTGQSSHPAARVGDPTEAQTRSRVPPVTEPDSWTPVVSRGTAKNNKRLARQRSWYQRQESTRRRRNTPSDGQTQSEPRLAGRLSTVPCPVGQMQRHEPNGQTMPAGCPIGQRRPVRCPDGHGQPPPGRQCRTDRRCPPSIRSDSVGMSVRTDTDNRHPVARTDRRCPPSIRSDSIGMSVRTDADRRHPVVRPYPRCPPGVRSDINCTNYLHRFRWDGVGLRSVRTDADSVRTDTDRCHLAVRSDTRCSLDVRSDTNCPNCPPRVRSDRVGLSGVRTDADSVRTGTDRCHLPADRPDGQTLFAGCQIGHQLSELPASCPIGPRRFEWCPDGRGQCPDGHGQCPDGRGLPALRPIGQRRYDRCPDGHGQCPDGHGQRPPECPTRHPWSVQRLPPWANNPARATPAGGSSASSGVSDDGSSEGPDIRVAKVRMMQGGGRGQGPSSSSDWSSTDSPTNSPRRDRPAQAPGRRATTPTDYDASQGHPEQADHSTGDVSEGARAREPTITMYRPSGGGSRTLPAGWREILPPIEAWGHSMDRGSEPESTRTAPQPGAGHSQARAHHSALPDNAGTQTDYRQSFGTLPELLPRTESTWPTVIIDRESPIGPPTHPLRVGRTAVCVSHTTAKSSPPEGGATECDGRRSPSTHGSCLPGTDEWGQANYRH